LILLLSCVINVLGLGLSVDDQYWKVET
jgi:hypothetical protein